MRPWVVTTMWCLAACARSEEPAAEAVATEVVASVGVAREEAFAELVDATGLVVPRLGGVATLAAPVPARVARVFVTTGSPVRAGDPLVEFEQAPFEATTRSAESALLAAEKAAERAQRLADAGVLARKESEVAAAELANARLVASTARRANELSTLRAPITGTVTRMTTTLGASVDPSQPLVEVADSRVLDVILTLSPADAARVRAHQGVSLYASAGASGEPLARGVVADVAAVVDSGGVAVRVHVTQSQRSMRLAEPMFGRIAVAVHAAAVVVPLEALVPTGEGFKVFIVGADNIAHETAVTVGGRTDTTAWISEGVRAGDRVVTKGAYGVDDSTKVVIGKS